MYRIAPGRLGSARDFDHPRHSHSPTTQGLSLHCTGDLVFQHSGARDRLTIPDTAHSAHTTLPGVIPMVVGAVFQHSGGREILTIPDTPTTSVVYIPAYTRPARCGPTDVYRPGAPCDAADTAASRFNSSIRTTPPGQTAATVSNTSCTSIRC